MNPEQRDRLARCCRSGAENPDSEVGCYIMDPRDLKDLGAFFRPLLRDYHHLSAADTFVTGWDLAGDGDRDLDLSTLGLPPVSMRVRVARNLQAFNLPGHMTKAERIGLEKTMLPLLRRLMERREYGGRVYSLTPEFGPNEPNPNLISTDEYQALVDARVMFKNMDADRFLKSAGLAADWPYGRACYVSSDREVIIWLGEEDHLRIMCMKTGTKLTSVFGRLRAVLDVIENFPGMDFVRDEEFGYVTSCPSNLGTGMRASVHVPMPHLMKPGADLAATCERFGLSVCGLAGEHSAVGPDGILSLSPKRRLFVREQEIMSNLFEGIRQLWRS